LSPLQATALAQIIMAENILSNNSSCAAGRHIPFFIYADSLSVTCKDLEKIVQNFDREVVHVKLLITLDSHFINLTAAGWQYLANTLEAPLSDREHRVFSTFATHWNEFHELLEALKSSCCNGTIDINDNGPFMTHFDTILRTHLTAMIESAQASIQDLVYIRAQDTEGEIE
jgi:hypothetical protein